MTLNRLSEMLMRCLSAAEVKRLKNRAGDHRPAVRELARAIYAERFPHAARNQRKQQLSIGEIQNTASTGGIPDRLSELLFSLSEFLE